MADLHAMRVLGIESSCDETAAAIVTGSGCVLSDVVRSQVAAHAPFGGIVPELAARDHIRAAVPVIREALSRAGVTLADLDGVAVTHRPGLIGALLVGVQVAKGLAWAAGKPLVGVDHLIGHLLSVFLQRNGTPAPVPEFPFLGLLVSGGHTALYRCDGPSSARMEELGATRDDAVGESFDKVAKLLGLGYPGGPVVDQMAKEGNGSVVLLPKPMRRPDSAEFSFSGIKSAMARIVAEREPTTREEIANLCAAFQTAVTTTLVEKTLRQAGRQHLTRVVVAGGVAANSELRARMASACAQAGIALFVPPFASCTDNAAMIAYAGAVELDAGERDDMTLGPATTTELPRRTRKGRGRR